MARATRACATSAAVDVDILLAWQRGMLIFQGEPLDTVLREFNRYTTDRFVVAIAGARHGARRRVLPRR